MGRGEVVIKVSDLLDLWVKLDHRNRELVALRQQNERLREVINRHYPAIAGHARRLQEAHEDRAAAEWLQVARDFYAALSPSMPEPSEETEERRVVWSEEEEE